MKTKSIQVYFYTGYAGGVKIEAREVIGKGTSKSPFEETGKKYVIENNIASEVLEKIIALNGYTTEKSNRQKYTRLIPKI